MDSEDRAFFRTLRNWIIGIVVLLMLLTGAAHVAGRAFDLAWYPFQIKMQTGMIRNSNSYITTQQTALREFRTDYENPNASDAQKLAITRQMHTIADTIPDDVQVDIRSFLATH